MDNVIKVLYVTQEICPYLPESEIADICRKLPQAIQENGKEIRTFMPKFGCINERRNQLHEVIRLSGMNLIIDDTDHQLIIKVASIQAARMQVYFIDNDDYFNRKSTTQDENGEDFDDNEDRAIFFARGVIETIKKLNWVPDIIHFNGWMASFIPIYLKNYYKTDSYFNDTKLVLSVYNEKDLSLGDNITEKLKFDNIENLKALEEPTIQSFVIESMNLVDTIVKGDEFLEEKLDKAFEESKTPKNEYVDGGSISEIY